MKILRDDEIEFLGGNTYRLIDGEIHNMYPDGRPDQKSPDDSDNDDDGPPDHPKKSRGCFWCIVATVIICCIGGFILWLNHGDSVSVEEPISEYAESANTATVSSINDLDTPINYIAAFTDSIDDVCMEFYPLDGTVAELSLNFPQSTDSSVMLAVPAADFRADNGGIIGYFYIDGNQVAYGHSRSGWLYISSGGSVTIGSGFNAAMHMVERAAASKASMFQQHPLVTEGHVNHNNIKGKSLRRAIGIYNNELYFVRSVNRESVNDFSNALADYGFTSALYLPGGNATRLIHTKDSIEYYKPDFDLLSGTTPQFNYLIFRSTTKSRVALSSEG